MPPTDALYAAVHDYPGGAAALAPRMGIAASTLLSFANPNCESHRWPLARALQVAALTGDKRPIEAICDEAGGVFIPLGAFAQVGNGTLFKRLTKLASEFGDVPRRIQQALTDDGRISTREWRDIRREIYELQQAAAAVGRVVEQMHDAHVTVPVDERPE